MNMWSNLDTNNKLYHLNIWIDQYIKINTTFNLSKLFKYVVSNNFCIFSTSETKANDGGPFREFIRNKYKDNNDKIGAENDIHHFKITIRNNNRWTYSITI